MTKIAGSGSESGSGSISQKHGSADPDLPQNVMDPEHSSTDPIFHSDADPDLQWARKVYAAVAEN